MTPSRTADLTLPAVTPSTSADVLGVTGGRVRSAELEEATLEEVVDIDGPVNIVSDATSPIGRSGP